MHGQYRQESKQKELVPLNYHQVVSYLKAENMPFLHVFLGPLFFFFFWSNDHVKFRAEDCSCGNLQPYLAMMYLNRAQGKMLSLKLKKLHGCKWNTMEHLQGRGGSRGMLVQASLGKSIHQKRGRVDGDLCNRNGEESEHLKLKIEQWLLIVIFIM